MELHGDKNSLFLLEFSAVIANALKAYSPSRNRNRNDREDADFLISRIVDIAEVHLRDTIRCWAGPANAVPRSCLVAKPQYVEWGFATFPYASKSAMSQTRLTVDPESVKRFVCP